MPKIYTPQRLYYGGETVYKSPHMYAFIIEERKISVYNFFKLNFQNNNIPSSCYVTSASKFFSVPLVAGQKKQLQKKPFCEQEELPDNVIKYTDIMDLGYNYYGASDSSLDLDTLYLRPEVCCVIDQEKLNFTNIEPNSDFLLELQFIGAVSDTHFNFYNGSNFSKLNSRSLDSFTQIHLMKVGTNFGKSNSFLDLDFIVTPKIKNFISNLNFTNGLEKVQQLDNGGESGSGVLNYEYQDRLKLKIEGPTTANIGDILEYNVTLMNNDFTDTYINSPDIEVYPTTEAGVILHRKIVLKNGIGKFKVDTSNLYSGETFDVKIGWKYRTNDSKVTVTVN